MVKNFRNEIPFLRAKNCRSSMAEVAIEELAKNSWDHEVSSPGNIHRPFLQT